MSTSTQRSSSWPELRTGPIITGASLFGAGALIALAGLAVGGSHLFAAIPPVDPGDGSTAQRAGEDQVGAGQDGRGPPVPPPGTTGPRLRRAHGT